MDAMEGKEEDMNRQDSQLESDTIDNLSTDDVITEGKDSQVQQQSEGRLNVMRQLSYKEKFKRNVSVGLLTLDSISKSGSSDLGGPRSVGALLKRSSSNVGPLLSPGEDQRHFYMKDKDGTVYKIGDFPHKFLSLFPLVESSEKRGGF